MKSKWELIKNTLKTKSIQSSQDLQEAILSYSPKYRGHEDWSFSTLHKLMSEVLTKEESEKFKEECEDVQRKLQVELMRREEVSFELKIV